jgi:aspartate aminotransferase
MAPSATAAVFERALELKQRGVDLISFAVGEPDFDTPEHVRQAGKEAIDAGATRYAEVAGIPDLREAICADSARRRKGSDYKPEEVVVSVGVKQALYNATQALYDPGDEVVIPSPCWVSYPEQARLAGATPVMVPCGEEEGFLLTPEALRRAVTPRSRALVLCSPNNPTGAAYSGEQLEELMAVAGERELWVIADEVYGRLTYDGFEQRSVIEAAPEMWDRVIIADGVSKSFAMTGWRIGWTLSPEPVARAMRAIQSQLTTHPDTVAQHAAAAALNGPQGSVEEMRRAFERRRDRMVAGLDGINGLKCSRPRGAFYAFASVAGIIGRKAGGRMLGSDVQVAEWLLQTARVVVVPGTAFSMPGYLRFSFAVADEQIESGLQRVAEAVATLG